MEKKPQKKEDEYFARLEFDRKKKEEGAGQGSLEQRQKDELKDLHFMHCPKCGMKLIEIDYKDLKIDKCSGCEGIWLDFGELEKILETEGSSVLGFLNIFKG